MSDNKNPDEKQPGEKPEGEFHYNPGNMAGKKIGDGQSKDEADGESPSHEKPAA